MSNAWGKDGRWRPIPVTERLPEWLNETHEHKTTRAVFVYSNGEYPGWSMAEYVMSSKGDAYWQYAAEGVSGYEWDVEQIDNVTHWLPDLPPPEDW